MNKIWTPPTAVVKQSLVEATVITARYDAELKCIAVLVHTADGKPHSCPILPTSYSWQGRPIEQVPMAEIDREMSKVAELLRRRVGLKIKVLIDDQIQ